MNLKIENLEKDFFPIKALKGLNLDGNFKSLAVVGPNGSGKTTLLSIITGLRRPTAGHLWLNDIEPYKNRERVLKEEISFVFEKTPHPYSMRVQEFVDFVGAMRGDRAKSKELAETIGLTDFYNNRMSTLSSGQSQLCDIFAGLCCWDGIIVLDEPFTHLDAFKTGKLIDMLFRRQNVILSTHIPEEAEALGDYIIVLDEGRLVWQGTREDLYAKDVYEVYLRDPEALKNLKVLYTFGRIALVRADCDSLTTIMDSGGIFGFRKSGIRRIYSEIIQR